MRSLVKRILVLSFIVLAQSASTTPQQERKTYTIGIVPQFEISKLHGIWQPILNHVERETGYKLKFTGSGSIPSFERELSQGGFDFAYMNPYHLLVANQKSGYQPILRDHARQLYGVLVVRKDSQITSPEQLSDKVIAFPAPNALGASLQMRQELFDKYNIKALANYVKSHDAVYLNVLTGMAVAGGGVQKTLNRQKQEYRDLLRVIYTTEKVAPHPLAVLPSVPDVVSERVRDALLALGDSDSGRELLAKIPMQRVGTASMSDYEPLKQFGLERFYIEP